MTKYGGEMTNALFPFIKPGPAADFPALGPHAPQKAHFNRPFANLTVVKVHQGSLLTLSVIDWSSLSSDLRQRIRGITSFERFDVAQTRPVLLCAHMLLCVQLVIIEHPLALK